MTAAPGTESGGSIQPRDTPASDRRSPRRRFRLLAIALAALTLAAVALLLAWDAFPAVFPPRAHSVLGAAPLALIALAVLSFQASRHGRHSAGIQALIVAGAFLFWSANQLFADRPIATLLNDLAIALFVLDVFLTVVR